MVMYESVDCNARPCHSASAGTVVGALTALLFKHVRMTRADSGLEVEKALLVTTPLISYMLSEGLGLSGVVSVLFTGIMMGRFTSKNVNVESRKFLVSFYRVLSLVCESLAFCYIGIALPLLGTSHLAPAGWAMAVSALGACLAARWISTWTCCTLVNFFRMPAERISPQVRYLLCPAWVGEFRLSHVSFPPTTQVRFAMWMSGLRGGVAFALSIAAQKIVANAAVGALIPAVTLFVVLVTSVVISGILPYALRWLDLVVANAAVAAPGTSTELSSASSRHLLALSGVAAEGRAGSPNLPEYVEAREHESDGLIIQQVADVAATGEQRIKRCSPRAVAQSSPERPQSTSVGMSVSGTASARDEPRSLASSDSTLRWADGARSAAFASSMRQVASQVSSAAAHASRSIQAAAEVVLVRHAIGEPEGQPEADDGGSAEPALGSIYISSNIQVVPPEEIAQRHSVGAASPGPLS